MKAFVTYTEELAEKICERLSTGETLSAICRDEGMPSDTAVRKWALTDYEGFADRYKAARDMGLDVMADQLFDIADDKSKDTYIDAEGNERCDKEWIARSRLRVDTRKWYMGKMAPKRYGERVEQHHTGDANAPVALILKGSDING